MLLLKSASAFSDGNWKHVLTTSVNSRWPSDHKRLVTPLFGNGFFCDNFVIFCRRSKRIAFFGINEFFYVCLFATVQFSWWSCDHFLAPFSDLYLPNAWSQTLQTSKRHTFRVSAFHRYHWVEI